jgi:hypothetical protein
MPKSLTAGEVDAITAEGTHRVDRGLYLQVRKDGTRSWLLRFRLRGRMRWMGLGPRIEHEPNSDPPLVVIKSVNPEYQTYERSADEVHVVGRVVWTSRRL